MENANASNDSLDTKVSTKMGDGMAQVQEPTEQVETTNQAEDPAIKNEDKRPDDNSQKEESKDGGDSKQNASTVINELGESRKKVIQKFIESAKKSGVAAEELKELIAGDKSLEKTIKSKFGNDYDALMRGDLTNKVEHTDEEYAQMKRKATLEAKLEVMKEEDQRIKDKQIEIFAESNGLNSDEVEALKENAELLSGKYEFEEALRKSLLLVNRDKSDDNKGFSLPTGGREKQVNTVNKNDPLLNTYKKHMPERDLSQVAQNIERVGQRIKRDDTGRESFSVSTH